LSKCRTLVKTQTTGHVQTIGDGNVKITFLPPSDNAGNTVQSEGALQPQHYIIYPYIQSCTKFRQGHWVFRGDPRCLSVECRLPIPAAARKKPCACGRSLIMVASSNPARCTGVCLLRVLYVLSCPTKCGEFNPVCSPNFNKEEAYMQ